MFPWLSLGRIYKLGVHLKEVGVQLDNVLSNPWTEMTATNWSCMCKVGCLKNIIGCLNDSWLPQLDHDLRYISGFPETLYDIIVLRLGGPPIREECYLVLFIELCVSIG